MMQSIDSRNIINAALAAFFVATVSIPFVGLWGTHDGGAEKRILAKMPAFPTSYEEVKKYPAAMQTFVNDNFGMRDDFLTLHADISRTVFRTSGSPYVVMGSGGWLFYTGDGSLADMQRQAAPDKVSLENWKNTLSDRATWLANQGITYRFVVAPDKHNLFPERLPIRYRWDGQSRVDRIKQYVGATASFVDLLPDLKKKKSAGADRLYFETDTHWTRYGAYIGYRTIMHSLGESYGPATLQLSEGDFSDDGSIQAHDLAIMSRSPALESGKTAGGFAACGKEVKVRPPEGVDVSQIMSFVGNECPSRTKTLLIFIDSFGAAMIPYINSTFGRVVYVWGKPTDELFVRMVLQERPDIVIEERVERFMDIAPVSSMSAALQKTHSTTSSSNPLHLLKTPQAAEAEHAGEKLPQVLVESGHRR